MRSTMWTLRRASIHLRNRGLSLGCTQIFCLKTEISSCYSGNNAGVVEPQEKQLGPLGYGARFYRTSFGLSKSYMEVRSFSSGASGNEADDGSISETEPYGDEDDGDDMQNVLEPIETEGDGGRKISQGSGVIPAMAKEIISAPISSLGEIMDKWIEEGNKVDHDVVSLTILHLRKRRMFHKALQLLEWLDDKKHLAFNEKTYASRVDLLAKLQGTLRAEKYLKEIPESCRGEKVYRTLLANSVRVNSVKKSEELFDKMKGLFPVTSFSCNQMLLLYKRTDKKKIANILSLMEKENIQPSQFTYLVLVDAKAQWNDTKGVEQIIKTMKSEGIEPNAPIQASLARHYVGAGQPDKALAILKEMEQQDDLPKHRWITVYLLPIYASLGREDDVRRIWKLCESNQPRAMECLAAINAWGQLKRVKEAEMAFEKIVELRKPNSKHYAALLNVYTSLKLIEKGNNLVQQMADTNSNIGPVAWHAFIKFYIQAGEVEKAVSILEKVTKQKKGKPLYVSYIVVLDQYAKKGDIHNAEKIFLMMKQAGYGTRAQPYQLLLQAYVSGKAPAYGFRERMKADNVVPNKMLSILLEKANGLRKSAVEELLE